MAYELIEIIRSEPTETGERRVAYLLKGSEREALVPEVCDAWLHLYQMHGLYETPALNWIWAAEQEIAEYEAEIPGHELVVTLRELFEGCKAAIQAEHPQMKECRFGWYSTPLDARVGRLLGLEDRDLIYLARSQHGMAV